MNEEIDPDYPVTPGDWDVHMKSITGNIYILRFIIIKQIRFGELLKLTASKLQDKCVRITRVR